MPPAPAAVEKNTKSAVVSSSPAGIDSKKRRPSFTKTADDFIFVFQRDVTDLDVVVIFYPVSGHINTNTAIR